MLADKGNYILEDYLGTLDSETLKKIKKVKKKWHETNGNSLWLIALALECKNLETLIIEDLEHLTKAALATLMSERKDTLKYLRITGNSICGTILYFYPNECNEIIEGNHNPHIYFLPLLKFTVFLIQG